MLTYLILGADSEDESSSDVVTPTTASADVAKKRKITDPFKREDSRPSTPGSTHSSESSQPSVLQAIESSNRMFASQLKAITRSQQEMMSHFTEVMKMAFQQPSKVCLLTFNYFRALCYIAILQLIRLMFWFSTSMYFHNSQLMSFQVGLDEWYLRLSINS